MSQDRSEFSAFWLYQRRDDWRQCLHPDWDQAVEVFSTLLEQPGERVTLRGVYSVMGMRPDVDMIVWAHAPKLEQLMKLAVQIDQTTIGRALKLAQSYVGVAGMSQYDPEHGPAFLKGIPARRYLSVYPFMKTPEWYLVPFEERRRLMIEHGEMGREFPEILTNTVNSFGIQDQEFIVALEDDDPHQLVKMVQRLRAAEVRKYTALDTPIYLGDRKSVCEVLNDIKG
ncbi:MAG TPA: chlorite dismutase family protein [Thermomicrobiales bacterium]|nr:chlorite dismutase family protein [Thermomicrobiales bacterium]